MKKENYFKRLGYTKQDIPTKKFSKSKILGMTDKIKYMNIEDFIKNESPEKLNRIFDFSKPPRQKNCGLGQAYIDEVNTKCNCGYYVKIDNQELTSISIAFLIDEKNDVLYDKTYIEITDGSRARIFFFVDSVDQEKTYEAFRNGLISIDLGNNAKLDLIKVQNIVETGINFETMKINTGEKSEMNFYDVQLGGKINGVSTTTYLPNENADIKIYPRYFVDKKRKFDLEQNLVVDGKKNTGLINANGVLKNTSKKMFRGNIFFNKGCSQSKARFADNTIMFDEGVVGMTVPTIFCDEHDVIGEHAASFEAIDSAKLYYLMSRGFDESGAKRLIAETTFRPAFEMIDDEHIKEKLSVTFSEQLSKEQS